MEQQYSLTFRGQLLWIGSDQECHDIVLAHKQTIRLLREHDILGTDDTNSIAEDGFTIEIYK